MRFLNRLYVLFFIVSGQSFCSVPSISMDNDTNTSEKKLHNAIASSVKNVTTVPVVSDEKKDTHALAKITSSHHTPKEIKKDDEHIVSKENKEKSDEESPSEDISIEPEIKRNEPGVLYQDAGFIDDHESVAFNFEDADLFNVALYMEKIHNIKFVTEDIISTAKDAKGLSGHKITFRTNKVLTKKESWDLFITFLHMAGLDMIPMMQAGFYKIVPFSKASGEAVPTYIGVDVAMLPDNDMLVRYVYFARNIDPIKIQPILAPMQAGSAKLQIFSELRAMIFLDRAKNIRSLMQIVTELDNSTLPECLSVVKIKRANVEDVKALYESLRPGGATSGAQPQKTWDFSKKKPSMEYFPHDVSLFSDKRTNSLILLGSKKGISKIEEFVEAYIDADINRDAPPIFTYLLEYTNADDIATLLNSVVQYGSGTPAGDYGGVRDGIKYFSKMTILAEKHSNSLIINATKEDYEALVPLIKQLDIAQKQIGLEVLIVQVDDSQAKTIGTQLSGPGGPGAPNPANLGAQTFAQNISAQTSGILGFGGTTASGSSGGSSSAPVVTTLTDTSNATTYSIKSSLAGLLGTSLNGVVNEAGAILVTFGKPIWALFKVLQSMVSSHIVANPFVVVSNNTQAVVNIGEQRRIIASEVVNGTGTTVSGTTPQNAVLGFTITPQINKSNIVNLTISVQNNQFIVAGSQSSATQSQKSITTSASVANGEVLVLGGIMSEQYNSTSRGVPFLEHIPVIGWLFKSKSKSVVKSHFLVFICPRVLESVEKKDVGTDAYTRYKMLEAQKEIDIIDELDWFASNRDPIQKAFFGDSMPKHLQQFTGQASSLSSKRKKIQQKKDAVRASSKKTKSIKTDSGSRISFENDFLQTPLTAPKEIKNSISKSAQQGGVHV